MLSNEHAHELLQFNGLGTDNVSTTMVTTNQLTIKISKPALIRSGNERCINSSLVKPLNLHIHMTE